MKTRTKSIFKVGDKVRRVNICAEGRVYDRIKYNKTYTIRNIIIYENLDEGRMDIVYLNGFSNGEGMWARRFVKARRKIT